MKQKLRDLKRRIEEADLAMIHAVTWDKPEEIVAAQKIKRDLMAEALRIRDDDVFLLVTGMTRQNAEKCYGTE